MSCAGGACAPRASALRRTRETRRAGGGLRAAHKRREYRSTYDNAVGRPDNERIKVSCVGASGRVSDGLCQKGDARYARHDDCNYNEEAIADVG